MIKTRCMVLVPAGPTTIREYLDDTLESINHHVGSANCIIAIVDDSRVSRFARLGDVFPNVVVLEAEDYGEGAEHTTQGALWCKQAHALKYLLQRYHFDLLLRMDTDALMIGDAPDEDVLAFFRSRPEVGLVGAFRRRGDGTDKTTAMTLKGRELTREMRLYRGLRDPKLVWTLRGLVKMAERHGYRRGDMCTGGACFLAREAIDAMHARGFLDLDVLRRSQMMDDGLLGLLCSAAGYHLADLPEDSDVLAVNWRGLPMPIGVLVEKGKKIVHSIKDEDEAVERTIRAYFRERRQRAAR